MIVPKALNGFFFIEGKSSLKKPMLDDLTATLSVALPDYPEAAARRLRIR
jgi:hypothetical protein